MITLALRSILFALLGLLLAAAPMNSSQNGIVIPLSIHNGFVEDNGHLNLERVAQHVADTSEKVLLGLRAYDSRNISHEKLEMRTSSESTKRETKTGSVVLTSQDRTYRGSIFVGTRRFEVVPDTGSSDLFVPGLAFRGRGHAFFDPTFRDSKAMPLNKPFTVAYVSGTAEGTLYKDVVTIAGVQAINQVFGAAHTMSADLIQNGVLGLAFPEISQFSGQTPLIHTLVRQGVLSKHILAFRLGTQSCSPVLSLGFIDKKAFYGPIIYQPVVKQGYWQILIDSFSVDGNHVRNFEAAVDTGTALILGPAVEVGTLLGGIPYLEAAPSSLGRDGLYTYPCNYVPQITIQIGGHSFEIPPESFNLGRISRLPGRCLAGIGVYKYAAPNFWVVGDTVLANFYVIFDAVTEPPRVGFARPKDRGCIVA